MSFWPATYRIDGWTSQPPWLNDAEVAHAWQSWPRFVDNPSAVTVWHPEIGANDLVPTGSPTMFNAGFGRFSSMGFGLFDVDAIAPSFSGATTPYSVAYLFTANTAQTLNRYGLAIASTADDRQSPLAMAFTGNNADFAFFRRDDANNQLNGGTFTCAVGTWYLVEAYFDGALFTSRLDGAIVDNAIPLVPPGLVTSDTFCLSAYHGASGHVLASTARFAALGATGGSVWSSSTQAAIREYLLRFKPVL